MPSDHSAVAGFRRLRPVIIGSLCDIGQHSDNCPLFLDIVANLVSESIFHHVPNIAMRAATLAL
jgi:hypothetical protein